MLAELLDGAAGTYLQNQTITPEQWGTVEGCNEWLNLSAPDIIRGLHRAYLEAGSDAVETNTFGASPSTLGEYDLSRVWIIRRFGILRLTECNAQAIQSRRAAYQFITDAFVRRCLPVRGLRKCG